MSSHKTYFTSLKILQVHDYLDLKRIKIFLQRSDKNNSPFLKLPSTYVVMLYIYVHIRMHIYE